MRTSSCEALFHNFSGSLLAADFGDEIPPSCRVCHHGDLVVCQPVKISIRVWSIAIIAWVEPSRLGACRPHFFHVLPSSFRMRDARHVSSIVLGADQDRKSEIFQCLRHVVNGRCGLIPSIRLPTRRAKNGLMHGAIWRACRCPGGPTGDAGTRSQVPIRNATAAGARCLRFHDSDILMSETSRSIEVARLNLMDDFTRWRRDFQTCGTSTYCGGAAILTVTLLRSVKLSSIPFSENSRPIPLCFRPP